MLILIVGIVLLTTACAILPSAGWVTFFSKNLPSAKFDFGEKYSVALPCGFEKMLETKKEDSLSIQYELRAKKPFYKFEIFSMSHEQLLILTVYKGPIANVHGKPFTIENYAGPLILNDDYSEDGYSNHAMTIYDTSRLLVVNLIIDKERFSKKESLEILSDIVRGIREK